MYKGQSNSKRSDQQKSQDAAHKPVSSSNQKPTTGQPQNIDKPRIIDSTIYCDMCEERITDLCGSFTNNCKGRGESSQDPCMVSIGQCGHVFHTHCMKHWWMCSTCTEDWALRVIIKRSDEIFHH